MEIKSEFYQNFRSYNLTGGIFGFDWEHPKRYNLNHKEYFVVAIIKTSRFPQDSMTLKNDPVFKLVAERTPNAENWMMTTYKLMPSEKFLRKGIDLKDQRFNETSFLGFREIYDLKGKLLDKSYLDGNSIIMK